MIVAAVVVLALLAAVAVLAALQGRQRDTAVGMVSRETRRRDRASAALGSAEELTGKQVEKAAALERRGSRRRAGRRRLGRPAPYVPRIPRPSASAVVSSSTGRSCSCSAWG
ncbi:MAG: hypothetical protein R2695_07235 [Acidimicrobiales bacterium]